MRFFKIGCVILILTCGIHLIGHFNNRQPGSDEEKQMMHLMETYQIPGAGVTMMSLLSGFSLMYSLWFLTLGTIGLMCTGRIMESYRRGFLWTVTGFTGVAVLISAYYFFYAPTACVSAAFVFLLIGSFIVKPGDSAV